MRRSEVVCDRCGKPVDYSNTMWAAIARIKRRKVVITQLYYGNMNGYDYTENKFDLCGDCTKALKKFMRESE